MILTAITDEAQQKKREKEIHPDEKTEGLLCDRYTHYTLTFILVKDVHPHVDLT